MSPSAPSTRHNLTSPQQTQQKQKATSAAATKQVQAASAAPIIRLVVAYAANRCIGKNNALPWHLPSDLAHFKKHTLGHPIIMGRKTWESIGRPLPGRANYVISRNPDYPAAGATTCTSLEQALQQCAQEPVVCIIGGAQIYAQALPLAHELYATEVHADVAGDSFFPPLTEQWQEQERYPQPAENGYEYDFVFYRKIAADANT